MDVELLDYLDNAKGFFVDFVDDVLEFGDLVITKENFSDPKLFINIWIALVIIGKNMCHVILHLIVKLPVG